MGLEVLPVADAAEHADIIMLLTPDELTPGIYKREIEPHLKPGKYLAVAHGFGIPLQEDRATSGSQRIHGRPKGTWSPCPTRIRSAVQAFRV
jgi:ketol-acid reductoisomerase